MGKRAGGVNVWAKAFAAIRPRNLAFCHMAAPLAEAAECGPGRQSWLGMRVGVTAYLLQGPLTGPIDGNQQTQ